MPTCLQGIGYLPRRQYEDDNAWEARVFKLSKNCPTVSQQVTDWNCCANSSSTEASFRVTGSKGIERHYERKLFDLYYILTVDVRKEINTPYLLSDFDT